jgi:hypothetical protein
MASSDEPRLGTAIGRAVSPWNSMVLASASVLTGMGVLLDMVNLLDDE